MLQTPSRGEVGAPHQCSSSTFWVNKLIFFDYWPAACGLLDLGVPIPFAVVVPDSGAPESGLLFPDSVEVSVSHSLGFLPKPKPAKKKVKKVYVEKEGL